MNPLHLPDAELAAHMAALDDEALSDLLAQIDAAEILARTSRPVVLADAAKWYATRLRWPVFPIIPTGKRPVIPRAHRDDAEQMACKRACGRDGHGLYDASLDVEQIEAWWTRWPEANIATPTGADGCGLDVIDVDGRTGLATLAAMKHADCSPDCCRTSFCPATGELPDVVARSFTPGSTDGPGRHLFIAATGDGNATGYLPGLDYRGRGGFVVIPPSIAVNGARYAWITRPELPRVAEVAA